MYEWKDFGEAIKGHIKVVHGGKGLHIDQEGMHVLEDEMDDIEHEYKMLHGSKWDKAYQAGWKAAFESPEGKSLGRRFETFSESAEWQALEKELKELDGALKKNVKITDLPSDATDMLKVHVSKAGHAAIEKEFNDVDELVESDKWKFSKPVRNMENSLERWGRSDEVAAIKALDKKFLASPEGKELMLEWKDFGMSLKEHIKKTKNGIHIDHEGMDIIQDEADDVEHEYKMLHGSKWEKAYDAAWAKATSSPEAKSVGRRFETFSKSAEWKALAKELHELDLALKKNVKVTDVPKDMDDMFVF